MLIEIYILFNILAVLFLILSIVMKNAVIFGLISATLLLVVGISSHSIDKSYCGMNETLSWDCHVENHSQDNYLSWLWIGLGIFMFFYSLVVGLIWSGEEMGDAAGDSPDRL